MIALNPMRFFFSIGYVFSENGNELNLFELINEGIAQMLELLNSLKLIVNQDSELVNKLEKEINGINFYKIPSDFLMNDDYVYYKEDQFFERGSKIRLMLGDESDKMRIPLKSCEDLPFFSSLCNLYEDFTIMHVIIRSMQNTLMPTFIKIYSDLTYNIYSFDSSIKTTLYRTVNNIAKEIEKDNIIQIIFIAEFQTTRPKNEEEYKKLVNMTSRDRIKLPHLDMLCSFSIGISLNIRSLKFDTKKLKDKDYVSSRIKAEQESKENYNEDSIMFLSPIIKEFRKIADVTLPKIRTV